MQSQNINLSYALTQEQVSKIQYAHQVFNAFTGSDTTINEFLNFVFSAEINHQLAAANAIERIMADKGRLQ